MVVVIRGVKRTEFTDDRGNKVSGTRLYFEFDDDSVNGVSCDSKYFSDDSNIKLPPIELNHKYEFVYDVTINGGKATAKLTAVKKLN